MSNAQKTRNAINGMTDSSLSAYINTLRHFMGIETDKAPDKASSTEEFDRLYESFVIARKEEGERQVFNS